MIFGQYNEKSLQENSLTHSVWEKAFSWIADQAATAPHGEHEIIGRDLYANVMHIPALSAEEGVFEVHEQYIDIHYCVEGAEIIGHAPVTALIEKTTLDTEKDYQLFVPSNEYSVYIMQKGDFAIFFPGEPHMPKIRAGSYNNLNKVVIKIHKKLLV